MKVTVKNLGLEKYSTKHSNTVHCELWNVDQKQSQACLVQCQWDFPSYYFTALPDTHDA